ncbi:putative ATP synthase subunit f, mitochondrial [Saccostrea echinata]|uniref:putative ATP synthase subunit f, mitochondrial n=1 Tax=Saccostrea echinata TaxID=191078 RepID=UPI002A837FD1|nr:putative ATP synthase subunit f, mitochondrial [Saccostrea echinata]
MGNIVQNASNFGEFPKEFNPRIHGAYQADRYYGTPDKAFSELKLGEVIPWMKRRDASLTGTARFFSRKLYGHQLRWHLCAKNRGVGVVHFALFFSFLGMLRCWNHDRHLDDFKYH